MTFDPIFRNLTRFFTFSLFVRRSLYRVTSDLDAEFEHILVVQTNC